ncbi:MAG: hypothetical protein GY737_26100 [Desulfobacteraceae bacterium]|nr:hypothetical protein [Desulfobacteraceae bacterium]
MEIKTANTILYCKKWKETVEFWSWDRVTDLTSAIKNRPVELCKPAMEKKNGYGK